VSPEATPPVVRYNRIAEATFKPWNLSRYLAYEGSGEKVLTDTRECDLGNIRELLDDVLLLLGAYRLGALLQLDLLAKTVPIEDVEFAMRSAVECWRRKRIVNRSEGSLEMRSGTRFSTGFYALLHGHAVLKGVKRLLGSSSDEASATFDEINKLRRLMEGSTVVKVLVDREISKLKRIWEKGQEKGILSSDWKLYADLLSEKAESEPEQEESEDMFRRNFIAHAGFHSKVVELRLKNDQLELRVRPSEWEMVKKVLRTVVREQ
jgi:CRISPR-associated protein Csx1